MTPIRVPLIVLLSAVMTACTSLPMQPPQQAATRTVRPGVRAADITPDIAASVSLPVEASAVDVWGRLRGSFAMADCDADPQVLAWAKRYTRHPERFEDQLRAALPQLVYVQQVAEQFGVAGEFALLPWVESQFQPVPARRRRPAGMWQIMPATAGAMGLRVDGHYDGRLDVPAAAQAVMKLLKQYHDQFDDWRVADYAYNTGEFSVRKFIQQRGMPPAAPVIPTWPVRKVTRDHLARLLAMACVVREPDRFNVSLPTLPANQHLVKMEMPHSMPMARAADRAGMTVDAMKHLNGAFGSDMINTDMASYLILPANHAEQFRHAMLAQPATTIAVEPLISEAEQPKDALPRQNPTPKSHTVRRGESLWQIAHHYAVGVDQLQHWNHLRGSVVKPGQVLRLSGVN